MSDTFDIVISTDGSGWRPKPSHPKAALAWPGGCAAVLRAGDRYKEAIEGSDDTTNNEMELFAILLGLSLVKWRHASILVRSDSMVAIGWAKGSMRRDRYPYASDYGMAIDGIVKLMDLRVFYKHIPGHSGDTDNDRADHLAGEERKRRLLLRNQALTAPLSGPSGPDTTTDALSFTTS